MTGLPLHVEASATLRVVVCERRPRWTPELQRQFAGQRLRVRSCGSAAEAGKLVRQRAAHLLVLDVDGDPAGCLQLLGRMLGGPHDVPVIAIGSERTSDLEWPARELGATAFLPDTVPGEELAALCSRALKELEGTAE